MTDPSFIRRIPGPPSPATIAFAVALLATLAALLLHASVYGFLTDDAFISFRYASNLAAGHGLVYNPGLERVEGYTNFLWVMLLAGAQRILNVAPEEAANPLLLAATVTLWAVVAREALRARGPGEPWWPSLVPLALLAATRSVAVWSTSGLETRLFELLVVAAALRLLAETRALLASGGSALFPWSGLLFALATLTRPDGALMAGCAMLVAATVARARWRRSWRTWGVQGLLFASPVALHLAWRRAYYGEWLPNTWFAKVGGLTWWEMGGAYLASFALEYGAVLWTVPLALALLRHARRGTAHVPLVYAAIVVPHALYVARIGGDHFEYRPLDLYFPFVFLLIGDGVREARDRIVGLRSGLRRRTGWAGGWAYLGLLLIGLAWIPWQSHRQYPERFVPGFPGVPSGEPSAARFLDPASDPLLRWPVLRQIGQAHRRLLHTTTGRLAGIRAEEHRLFLEAAESTGLRLRALVEQGLIPPDTHIAISAAGVVPYRSGLRTLDRLGLTDRVVARSAPTEPRMLGHERYATLGHAARMGVDLWAEDPVHLVLDPGGERLPALLDAARRREGDVYFAYAQGDVLVARLPQGVDEAARRFPRLRFHSLLRDAQASAELDEAIAEATRRRLAEDPHSTEAQVAAAMARAGTGDVAGAIAALAPLAGSRDPRVLATLGMLHGRIGQYQESVRLLRQAAELVPDLLGLHYNLGIALWELERWDEARAAFAQAVRLEPDDAQLRYALGTTCFVLDDRECTEAQALALEGIGSEAARQWAANLRRALEGGA